MGENVPQSVEVPVGLETFGGLITEMAPSDLPEGVSPDNQDVVYVPGSVASRPCLNRLYNQLPLGATVTYIKTFVQADGTPLTLLVDSTGGVWKEDVLNTPGVLVAIGQVSPGSYCSSVTAFGREYMVFHDGVNGTDIPRQFDGTNFDRVSQDGPGAAPSLSNYSFIAAAIQNTGPGGAIAIATAVATDLVTVTVPSGFSKEDDPEDFTVNIYNSILFTTGAAHGLSVGSIITVAGNGDANANGTWTVTAIISGTQFKVAWGNSVFVNGAGGTVTGTLPSISRQGNIVTVTTPVDHNFPTGFRVSISGMPTPNIVGISALVRLGGISTCTTAAAHGLQAGESIIIAGAADASFNGQTTVFSITDATHFTYLQTGAADLTVGAAGNVQDVWNGTFVITSVPTTKTFTYFQIGINSQNNTTGAATILGRVVLGPRTCVVMFLTRNGYITKPSPVTTISSNGGQSLYVQNIPLGPPNVIARILGFTPAFGGNYFYIPAPAVFNGVIQSTSTIIPDNVSTTALLDFSDNALQDATPMDVKGNNLFALQVLGPSIGVFAYGSRTLWWGWKNSVTNFINLGMDGGYLPIAHPIPLGWRTETPNAPGGTLVNGDFGFAWQVLTGAAGNLGFLWQPAYQDENNISIIEALTTYRFKAWIRPTVAGMNGNVVCDIYSPSTLTVLASASVPLAGLSTLGSFAQVDFTQAMPAVIPSDTILRLYVNSLTAAQAVSIDEIEIIFRKNPTSTQFKFSYIENPESFDGVTGLLGPADDDGFLQACFEYHGTLNFLTSHGLHETHDSSTSEPSGWVVNEVSNKCGCASPRACDSAENFAAWFSSPISNPPTGRGLYMYTGGSVVKVSQEIQPDFDAINSNAAQSIWVKNDPVNRRVLIGVPIGSATAPNLIYPLDYRELDTAADIANRPPIHISYTGKMICSDLSRKWTRWNITANCAEMVRTGTSENVTLVLGGGNGATPVPGNGAGLRANAYYMNENLMTDDDYGMVVPYYTTYFFVNHEAESALQVGLHRKLFKRYAAFMTGYGLLSITPYANSLSNPYPSPPNWPLNATSTYDIGDGLNIITERCAFKIASLPNLLLHPTDNSFNTGKFIITLTQEPVAPIRFGAV